MSTRRFLSRFTIVNTILVVAIVLVYTPLAFAPLGELLYSVPYQDDDVLISFRKSYFTDSINDKIFCLDIRVKIVAKNKFIHLEDTGHTIELLDNYGNVIGHDRLFGKVFGNNINIPLRPDEVYIFTLRFNNYPLAETKYIVLKVPEKVFGNKLPFELEIGKICWENKNFIAYADPFAENEEVDDSHIHIMDWWNKFDAKITNEFQENQTISNILKGQTKTNTPVGLYGDIKNGWDNCKVEFGINNDGVLALILLLATLCCILVIWGLCFLLKTSFKRGHIKFVTSLSLLPGILRLLYSAIFSSEFGHKLEYEPESFILTFAVGFACIWILYILWLFGLKSPPKVSKVKNNIADCEEEKLRQAMEIKSPCIPKQMTIQNANNVTKPVKSKWFSCDWLSIWGFTPSKTSLIISACAWIFCVIFPPGGYGESYLTSAIIGKITGYAIGALLITFVIPGIVSAIMYHISNKSTQFANLVFCGIAVALAFGVVPLLWTVRF